MLINKQSAWSQAGNKCPFRNGALKQFSKEKLFEQLGSKACNLVVDELADQAIAPVNGPESSGGSNRYRAGFRDIVQKHFLGKLDEQAEGQKKVIVMVSHSDGITPFMNEYFPSSQEKISKPCYCATLAVELSASSPDKASVEKCHII